MSLFDSFFPDDPPAGRSLDDREAIARQVVNTWAVGNGALSAVTRNRWALGAADMAMVAGVARAFGVSSYGTEAIVAATGAAAARHLAGWLPDFGSTLVRSSIHGAVTKAVGEAVIDHFRAEAAHATPPPSGRASFTSQGPRKINGMDFVK